MERKLNAELWDKGTILSQRCHITGESGKAGSQNQAQHSQYRAGLFLAGDLGHFIIGVSILRISRFETGLTEKCRLLISGSTGDRDRSAEDGRICLSVNAAGRLRCRKHTAWDLKFFENLVIPV